MKLEDSDGVIINFQLYDDADILIDPKAFTENQIEALGDDDVQSDNGVMHNAREACRRDMAQMDYLWRHRKPRQIIRNKELAQRCKFPCLFDRAGIYKQPKASPSRHVQLQTASVISRSECQSKLKR